MSQASTMRCDKCETGRAVQSIRLKGTEQFAYYCSEDSIYPEPSTIEEEFQWHGSLNKWVSIDHI